MQHYVFYMLYKKPFVINLCVQKTLNITRVSAFLIVYELTENNKTYLLCFKSL